MEYERSIRHRRKHVVHACAHFGAKELGGDAIRSVNQLLLASKTIFHEVPTHLSCAVKDKSRRLKTAQGCMRHGATPARRGCFRRKKGTKGIDVVTINTDTIA